MISCNAEVVYIKQSYHLYIYKEYLTFITTNKLFVILQSTEFNACNNLPMSSFVTYKTMNEHNMFRFSLYDTFYIDQHITQYIQNKQRTRLKYLLTCKPAWVDECRTNDSNYTSGNQNYNP